MSFDVIRGISEWFNYKTMANQIGIIGRKTMWRNKMNCVFCDLSSAYLTGIWLRSTLRSESMNDGTSATRSIEFFSSAIRKTRCQQTRSISRSNRHSTSLASVDSFRSFVSNDRVGERKKQKRKANISASSNGLCDVMKTKYFVKNMYSIATPVHDILAQLQLLRVSVLTTRNQTNAI